MSDRAQPDETTRVFGPWAESLVTHLPDRPLHLLAKAYDAFVNGISVVLDTAQRLRTRSSHGPIRMAGDPRATDRV